MHGKLKILALCLLLSAPLWGQSTMRNIPVPHVSGAAFTCGTATGYSGSLTITIATQGGLSGNLTNKDFIFAGDSHLASLASSGTDVVFCTKNDSTGAILPSELVAGTYNSGTGAGEWFVQAPTISHTTTETIYALYGKTSATSYNNPFTATGSVTSGSFTFGETITQTATGVTATFLQISPFTFRNLSAATTVANTNTWTGASSGAVFTPTGVPIAAVWPNFYYVYHWGTSGSLVLTDSTGICTSPTNGGATAVAGQVAGAASFLGSSSQYIDTGCFLTFGITNFTVETWVANGLNYGGSSAGVWGGNTGIGGGGLVSYILGNGFAGCGVAQCGSVGYTTNIGSYYYRYSSTAFGSTNVWHYLVGSHATGSANMTLYVDGAAQTGSVNQAGTPVDMNNQAIDMFFGKDGTLSPQYYYTGYVGEARLNSTVLSADWIKFDNSNQATPSGTYTVTSP